MPIVNGPIHETAGPTVELLVGVSGARRELLERNGLTVPPRVRVQALIDTGAGMSGIDQSILQQLDLGASPLSRKIHTSSTAPGQPHNCDEYNVGLFLPHAEGEMYLLSVLVISTRFVAQERGKRLSAGMCCLIAISLIMGRRELSPWPFEFPTVAAQKPRWQVNSQTRGLNATPHQRHRGRADPRNMRRPHGRRRRQGP